MAEGLRGEFGGGVKPGGLTSGVGLGGVGARHRCLWLFFCFLGLGSGDRESGRGGVLGLAGGECGESWWCGVVGCRGERVGAGGDLWCGGVWRTLFVRIFNFEFGLNDPAGCDLEGNHTW